MSSTITVFAVSLERIKQAVGSQDESLLAQIVTEQDYYLKNTDSIDGDCDFKCEDALADIIHGRVTEDMAGYLYGYAFGIICRQLGVELDNIPGIARAATWIERIDASLQEIFSPIQLSDFLYTGCPISIPEPDDYPFIGHLPATRIAAILGELSTLDLTGLESNAAEILGQMTAWLKTANTTPGASLVGFLS